jgi:predicted nucleotidyltransferase
MSSLFSPTQNPELNIVLDALVTGIKAILGEKFLGAYLGGSFAHGGWDADSDVDFDVVIESNLTPNELADLKVHHARVYARESYWTRHLEGAYFPVDILSDLDNTDQPIWYLDNGSLNFELSLHDNTLVNRWVLREKGIILVGPDPKMWIPPIPGELLKGEIRQTMVDWWAEIIEGSYKLDNRWAQTFAVLMYCRMLHSLATGEVRSKPMGAAWAKTALDPIWRALIDDALSARPNQYEKYYLPADPEKVRLTHAFIAYAVDWPSNSLVSKP